MNGLTASGVSHFLQAAGLIACVMGCLSCVTIVTAGRRNGAGTAAAFTVRLACWSANFFFGSALLLVNCLMGDRAPLPVTLGYGESLGLGSILGLWFVTCAALFAGSVAGQLHRRHREAEGRCHDPFRMHPGRRALLVLLACVAAALLQGCQVLEGAGPTPFVRGEDAAYQAIAPAYTSYVTNDLNLDPDAKARRLRTVRAWRMAIDGQLGVATNETGNVRPIAGPTSQPAGRP